MDEEYAIRITLIAVVSVIGDAILDTITLLGNLYIEAGFLGYVSLGSLSVGTGIIAMLVYTVHHFFHFHRLEVEIK